MGKQTNAPELCVLPFDGTYVNACVFIRILNGRLQLLPSLKLRVVRTYNFCPTEIKPDENGVIETDRNSGYS